jgi:SEC-C motif-containing protein
VGKIGRNERCPCGSGEKFKRCCGTREAQAVIERKAGALEELITLAQLFPRLRPRGEAFGAWADRVAALELGGPRLDEGLALVEPAELGRIERAHAEEFPDVWRSLVDDLGDEQFAREAVVRGAVAAGVWERRPLDATALRWLGSPDEDPSEVLALVLDAGDLWSVHESVTAEAALVELDEGLDDEAYELAWNAALAERASGLWTEWHDARLAELVARLGSRLPLEDLPAATVTLAAACEAFAHDAVVRRRVGDMLLEDSFSRTRLALALAA